MKAETDETYRKELAEEIIARMIHGTCMGPKSDSYKIAAPEHHFLVREFFEKFPNSADKVHIVGIAIGTQAAFDLIDGDDARGKCAIAKFLSGKNAPGFGELVSTLRNEQSSPNTAVEEVLLKLITKHCGLDAYQNFMNTSRAAIGFLEEEKKKHKKAMKETEAALVEMLKHAYRVPDGRAIFENEAGTRWIFEDGKTTVPDDLVQQRIVPPPEGWPDVKFPARTE